ncbi:MAG: tRNA 2-thiocytidine biosynthesis TtcA family protein [Bacilli bacterium]|jgi:tRNA(Ile)-lysidine synthase TilS/MesJ|nr:tRNA 2-thiocytidine biosynthesis TtcA family protein [Bacilli bacterium]
MKYIRHVLAALRKADRDFSLIDEGDKILVGLSGGKDSLCLLRALSLYGRFAAKNFEVKPVYLDLGFGNPDLSALKAFCHSLGSELYVSDSRFVYDILKAHAKGGRHLPCSICSRMKKAAMNAVAKKLGYNKVAFAHHSDDATETLFMNMIHGGRVATFEPKMRLERAHVTFIRPLIYCYERDLSLLAEEERMPVLKSQCPANGFTDRQATKDLLRSIYAQWPEAKGNFRSMLTNYAPFKLYFSALEFESALDHSYALKPIISAQDIVGTPFAGKPLREGESLYLILRRHERVGTLAYRRLSGHRFVIEGLSGPQKAQTIAVQEIVDILSKTANPVTFVLLGCSKRTKSEAGFLKMKEPGRKTERYIRRIEK